MAQHNRDLWLITILAAIGLAVQTVPVPAAARVAAGLALALLCPGYALAAAWFPGLSLGRAEQAALSFGLSVALATLGGVMLNLTPGGLTTAALAGLFFGVTLAGSLAAGWRRWRLTPATTARPWERPWLRSLLPWAQLGLAALVTIGAVTLVQSPRLATGLTGYTLLWLVPDSAPRAPRLNLGVSNSELSPVSYRLSLNLNGHLIHQWPTITLAPGEQWEQVVAPPPAHPGAVVLAVLVREDDPAFVYRSVSVVLKP